MRQKSSLLVAVLAGGSLIQAAGCVEREPSTSSVESVHAEEPSAENVSQAPTPDPASAVRPTTRYKDVIGPQFYPYSLDEYEIVDHDILPGLSGRFVSVRYRLKESGSIDRHTLEQRISSALLGDGWVTNQLPEQGPMTKKYLLTEDDLYFTRGSFASDDDVHTYNQRISISKDATEIACYWEAFWS